MKYLSGRHALNIDCSLKTCGDWHRSGIRWDVINDRLRESDDSIFGDYGIEKDKVLNFLDGSPIYNVANHIRACLDLIADGYFILAQGMRDDYICTKKYDNEIFKKVTLLRSSDDWDKIDEFMGKEYMMRWVNYKKRVGLL